MTIIKLLLKSRNKFNNRKKINMKNKIIGILVVLVLTLITCTGCDFFNKDKQENNNLSDKNQVNDNKDEDIEKDDCGNNCYKNISQNALDAFEWFYDNNKILDILFELGSFNEFNIETANSDDYFKFIVTYITQNGENTSDYRIKKISREELKKVLLKYFDVSNVDEVLENVKTHQNKEICEDFTFKDDAYYVTYNGRGYDYSYKIIDYDELNANEIVLKTLKFNSYNVKLSETGKNITLTKVDNGYKIKQISN